MYHDIHFTSRKIARLLNLVESRVYRRWQPLEPFAFLQLNNPTETPPVEPLPGLPRLQPNTYWGGQEVNFALYGSFTVPADFAADRLALFMPLGDARTFSHPESLVHIDGTPIASNDRHHQELRIDPRYADGQPHALLLHGWIGMIDAAFLAEPGKQVFVRACGLAELDLPTRAFGILARMALQAADLLAEGQPERTRLSPNAPASITRWMTPLPCWIPVTRPATPFMPVSRLPWKRCKPAWPRPVSRWMWS